MIHLSHLEKNKINIADIATPESTEDRAQFNPRNFIGEEDIQIILSQLKPERGDAGFSWFWARLNQLTILFPERRDAFLHNRATWEQFQETLQATDVDSDYIFIQMLGYGRRLFPDETSRSEFALETNEVRIQKLLGFAEQSHIDEEWPQLLSTISLINLAYPSYYVHSNAIYYGPLLNSLHEGFYKNNLHNAGSSYLSDLRLVLPHAFKPSLAELRSKKEIVLNTPRKDAVLTHFWKQAVELGIMAADLVLITDKGLRLHFGDSTPIQEEAHNPPMRRNF